MDASGEPCDASPELVAPRNFSFRREERISERAAIADRYLPFDGTVYLLISKESGDAADVYLHRMALRALIPFLVASAAFALSASGASDMVPGGTSKIIGTWNTWLANSGGIIQ